MALLCGSPSWHYTSSPPPPPPLPSPQPEGEPRCDQSHGVREYMYQLGAVRRRRGCMYIHHNHWLAHALVGLGTVLYPQWRSFRRIIDSLRSRPKRTPPPRHQGQDLPRERIITPYVAPRHVARAVRDAGLNPKTGDISESTTPLRGAEGGGREEGRCRHNSTRTQTSPTPDLKENLVLIDDDVPTAIAEHIARAAEAHNGTALVVKDLPRESLPDLFLRAKLVVDWCMR